MNGALEETAAFLLEQAKRHGATAADALVAEGSSLSVGVRLGEVEKVKRADAKHLGLRVFVGQRSAVTSTAEFSRAALIALAEQTVALARVTAADPHAGLASEQELARELPDMDLCDPAVADVSPEQAVGWCQAGEAAALQADARLNNSEGAEFSCSTNRIAYAATNGFAGSYGTSHCGLWIVPVASENGSMERDYWYTSGRHLDSLESPEAVGRKAAERTLRRLGARKVATCEVPVIFDPDTAASLLGHLAGAVSGNALYKGMSFLIGRLGERIAPAFVEVVDDGTLPASLGSKPFDAEGVATRCTAVLKGGVLASYLFDTYSARKLGASTTGNAARSVADSPAVSPTNFFLRPGPTPAAEIISSVRAGLYVTELLGFGVNPATGDYSRGASGLWIENGELAYPVSEITIAGNLLRMFGDIEAVGDDLVMRRSVASPTLKIGRLTVAGR